jgi:Mrp family chromosome partitioning ATPase
MSFIERAIEMAKTQRAAEDSRRERGHTAGQSKREPRPQRIATPLLPSSGSPATSMPPIDLARAPVFVTNVEELRRNRVLVDSAARHPAENAYRMLRTRVLRQMRNGGWSKLGITAAGSNEGKTLTAINLALTIAAERAQPVVLIDLDLKRPRIHRYLGIPETRFADVADYLEGRTGSLDELPISIGDYGLHCILSARPIERSSDLLASPQGQAFLGDLVNRLPGALLIFDLPPLLATDDPLVVAPMLDAVLLVVAERGCPRDDVANAARLLGEFNVLGAVLNKSSERGDQTYYTY